MRSTSSRYLAALAVPALLLAACSSGDAEADSTAEATESASGQDADADTADGNGEDGDVEVLQVVAVQPPMTDVVEAAGEAIQGPYEIELVEVSDYVTANTILQAGDVYANFSQHIPYMADFNAANDGDLVAVQPVYNYIIAFYSKTLASIDDLPQGATVAIPNDVSNRGRALRLLSSEGIITLDPEVDPYTATVDDITENPHEVEFLEVEISQLNAAYDEADLVFQWPSHIAALGLTPQEDGLITELDDRFELNVVVKSENVDAPATEALREAFASDEVREVIEENGTITASF